jgi:6,7-dimethyl-8-ribityllumazine synthase
MKIGVVTAKFNREITQELEKGALDYLQSQKIDSKNIINVHVPGAIEIPLATKALLAKGCDAVIALGAVIRGDTSHYDLVCNSVERGIGQLMLETGKPIAFGVITTENEDQAWSRTTGSHGNKGTEAAQVALEMLQLLKELK